MNLLCLIVYSRSGSHAIPSRIVRAKILAANEFEAMPWITTACEPTTAPYAFLPMRVRCMRLGCYVVNAIMDDNVYRPIIPCIFLP